MYPILLRWGDFRISTYGILIACAFIVAFSFVVRQGKKEGYDPNVILDLCYYMLIAAILGSRVFYIIVNLDFYLSHPLEIIMIWKGGLVFYGGLIGGLLITVWYIRKNKFNFFQMADFLIPAIPLGHAIGRLGCLFAGCCYGRHAADLPWAITFSNAESLAPKNIPLHPSQIYSSLAGLSLFLFLFLFRRVRKFQGQVFAVYFIIYPIVRVILERFRGDVTRKFLPVPGFPDMISTGDTVSFFLFAFGLGLYFFLRHKSMGKNPVTA